MMSGHRGPNTVIRYGHGRKNLGLLAVNTSVTMKNEAGVVVKLITLVRGAS
jgi:hypothetical protein